MFLQTRDDFPTLIDSLGLVTAAEIGVQAGLFSRVLLRSKIERLLMVDSWPDPNHGGYREEAYRLAQEFSGRAVILQQNSVEAAAAQPDQSIDFVYIDAMHEYPWIIDDIAAWWPKTRRILAGHDYMPYNAVVGCPCGVLQAVEEFAARENLVVNVTGLVNSGWLSRVSAGIAAVDLGRAAQPIQIPSWWIERPV